MIVVSCCTRGEELWSEFSPLEIGDIFAFGSTTMVKRMVQADSTHQIGLKSTLQAFLILAESGDKGGSQKLAHPQKLEMFLLVPQQPVIPSTTGGRRRIQRIKMV
jgi:hypothetical protein